MNKTQFSSTRLGRKGNLLFVTVVATLCGLGRVASAQCQYEVTAVIQHPGCPPPFTSSSLTATALNSLGHVTGYYVNCVTLRDEGFIWTPEGGLVTMTRPPGVVEIQPEDINDQGVVVGSWWTTDPLRDRRGFVYWPKTQTYTELDTLSGAGWSMAHAINNNNVVVGERATTDKAAPRIAFVWSQKDGFDSMGLTSDVSAGNDISDSGLVVGIHANSGDNFYQGFLFDGNGLIQIGPIPGGFSSTPNSINESGQVGGFGRAAAGRNHGYIWHDGTFEIIPPVGDDIVSIVTAINELGHAMVRSRDPAKTDSSPYLWVDGIYHSIIDMLPPDSELLLSDALDINDNGQLLVDEFSNRAILLTPINRPYTDLTADCRTDAADLLLLFDHWATSFAPADFNNDRRVDVFDLFELLSNWG